MLAQAPEPESRPCAVPFHVLFCLLQDEQEWLWPCGMLHAAQNRIRDVSVTQSFSAPTDGADFRRSVALAALSSLQICFWQQIVGCVCLVRPAFT